jgi:hypothetical protein
VRRAHVSLAIVAGLLTVGIVTPALAAGPYPPPPKGTGRVDPSRIAVGECAVFSGDGFAPSTAVTVSDNGVVRGTTTTSGSGTFSFQLCYPSDAQKGRHDLAGAGTGAGGTPLTVYAVLTVTGVKQSRSNPTTQSGGTASSTTGGPTSTSTDPEAQSGTTGAVQESPAVNEGASVVPAGTENSGTRLIMLALGGVALAFLASMLLLLLARRRRRREDEGDFDPALMPA